MRREIIIALLAVYAAFVPASNATAVTDCKTGDEYEDPNQVNISDCDEPPCLLKQGTTVAVEQHFVPDKNIQSLKTTVNAVIGIIPLPFVGVSGTNACDRIYHPDGTKAGCPLAKGKEYVYKNSFPVHTFYPRLEVTVHWALTEGRTDRMCFEVPAKIVA